MLDTSIRRWDRGFRGCLLLCLSLSLSACGGGGGGKSADNGAEPATVTPPLVMSLAATVAEDATLTGTLQAQDPAGMPLTFSSAQPANGSVMVSTNGSFTYQPRTDFFGTDQFTYTVSNGRATASAAVTVQVTPVNDPPQFGAIQIPEALARTRIEILVPLTDPDGPITSSVVEQLSGPTLGRQLQVADGRLVFNAPDVAAVERVALRFQATDDQGASASANVDFSLLPRARSGKLTTILGQAAGPGINLVITGDGFRAEELPALRAAALSTVNFVLDTPEVQIYKPAFNVHVLEAVSQESGLDMPAQGIFRDTIFNATAECLEGIERLVCVDTSRVINAVIDELPNFDFILTLVNTTFYGGSGGEIAVSTLSPDADFVVLHELGHSLAGLADEYVDEVAAPSFLPFYREDQFANVTTNPASEQTKWRHWFADPSNVPRAFDARGVGLFEGAYYQATGYFRPTSDSFMRTLQRQMGPVNTEAWALAIYDLTGAVTSAQPEQSVVLAAPGSAATFSIAKLLPGTTQQVQWLVDGVESVEARNLERFNCCAELTGEHAITVRVSDVSGKIRTPTPRASRFERTWTLRIGQLP